MAMSDDLAGDCTAALKVLINAVLVAPGGQPMLDDKHVFVVEDEVALGQQIRIGIKAPLAGIIYGGLQPIPNADASRSGRTVDVRVGVLYGVVTRAIGNVDAQPTAWKLLSAMRKAIVGQRSPTGHVWRFAGEHFLGSKNDAAYYSQQFAAVAILT